MTDALVPTDALEQHRVAFCKQIRRHLASGNPELAYDTAVVLVKECHASGYAKGEASALLMKALAYANLQLADPTKVLTTAHRALFALQTSNDPQSELEVMKLICQSHVGARDFELATSTSRDMVQRAKDIGDDAAIADALYTVAEVCLANREQDDAIQAAKDATALYQKVGNRCGEARCKLLSSDVSLLLGDSNTAMEDALKAVAIFEREGDKQGLAGALHRQCLAQRQEGSHTEALRTVEKAVRYWREAGNTKNMIDGMITEIAVKIDVCQEKGTHHNILKGAKVAVSMAKQHRSNDPVCLGNALYTEARALQKSNDIKGTMMSAQRAVRFFKQTGNLKLKAHSQLLWAGAALKMNSFQAARENVYEALAFFDTDGDEDGRARALEVEEQVDIIEGKPTKSYLAALMQQQQIQQQQMQQQLMMQQQQQMLMMGQQQGQGKPQGMQAQQMTMVDFSTQQTKPADMPAADRQVARLDKDRGAALDMSSGLDVEMIKAKVLELAAAVIGDTDDDLEADTPLMEAGLTSNSAVLLRDELSKDIPGVNLPPTLIFDYPSITAMAEFIVEKSNAKKK